MPRKRLDDDMSKFYDWMVACGFSPSTAKVYTSSCRSMKRKLGDDFMNADVLQPFLAEVKVDHPKVYATYVSAFHCLNRFHGLDGKVVTADDVKAVEPPDAKKKYPVTVQLAIKVIENYNRKAENKVELSY